MSRHSLPTALSAPGLRRVLALAVCGLAVAATAACGGGSSDSSGNSAPSSSAPKSSSSADASESPAAAGATITITDFMFGTPATVSAGAEVTVQNDDTTAHTVTASGDGGFDVTVQAGESATFTAPSSAGDYPFVCTFHGNMKGTLTVA